MESNAILVINLALIAGLMTALWLISLRIRNASIVDVFWGLGFVLVSWTTVVLTDTTAMRRWVIVATATFWGTRLAAYLAWRNLGKPEDYRYGAMRDRYGDRFAWVSALLVFGLQGMLMWIVSWPLQLGQQSAAALNWLDVLGVVLWTVGWLFETVGDWQLARFKRQSQHAGQVMDRGLWRYTRHPNYFGDFLVWWGFYLMAVASQRTVVDDRQSAGHVGVVDASLRCHTAGAEPADAASASTPTTCVGQARFSPGPRAIE